MQHAAQPRRSRSPPPLASCSPALLLSLSPPSPPPPLASRSPAALSSRSPPLALCSPAPLSSLASRSPAVLSHARRRRRRSHCAQDA
uniref:Uncharacterized protein n=1 Tax=Oryza rufipogon TaxID=4529 RepID=A0A0E0NQN6_ORYRU